MNYWSMGPCLSPPEPRDHWYDCPAHEENGGEEYECECDEITADARHDAAQQRDDIRRGK